MAQAAEQLVRDASAAGRGGSSDDSSDDNVVDEEMWADLAENLNLRQTVFGMDNTEHELVPGGRNMVVPWEGRRLWMDMVKDFRVNELSAQWRACGAQGIAGGRAGRESVEGGDQDGVRRRD